MFDVQVIVQGLQCRFNSTDGLKDNGSISNILPDRAQELKLQIVFWPRERSLSYPRGVRNMFTTSTAEMRCTTGVKPIW